MAELTIPSALQLAIQHHQAGRLREAEASYRKILARDPQCVDALHLLGVIAHQVGQHELAVELIGRAAALAPDTPAIHSNLGEAYRHLHRLDAAVANFHRALTLQPDFPDALNNLGNALIAQHKPDEAEACFRRALALQPDLCSAHYNLGLILRARGQLNEAVASLRQTLVLNPNLAEAHNNLGSLFGDLGRFDEALACFHQALVLKPDFSQAHSNVGDLLRLRGQIDEAVAAYRQALAFNPDLASAHYHLGLIAIARGRSDEALASFRQALALQPNFAIAHYHLGNFCMERGQSEEAAAYFLKALALDPGLAEAHNNLGGLLKDRGQLDDAAACFQRALELKPDLAQAHSNLGQIFRLRGELDEAVACYRRTLALDPALAETHNSLGNALGDLGQFDEAILSYRRAGELKGNDPQVHSNLVYTLHFHPRYDAQAIHQEHRRWCEEHATPLTKSIPPHPNDRTPDRRLRLGYVSPDFRHQAECFFVLPLLEAHDHAQVEVHAYASVRAPDATTERMRRSFDVWHDVLHLTDAQLADQIRADGIDILIDLTMHMANHRLLTFARKPAPVQVTWLAYPATTGLAAIDYRLSDRRLEPPGESDPFSAEIPVRLPDSWCCYDPLIERPPSCVPPAMQTGRITFGSLNHFRKINEEVLHLWARVLVAVPDSRLLLLSPAGSAQERVSTMLSKQGVTADRVAFVSLQPRPEYLQTYEQIDICLDPFPYNGITTTLDALWMGVPVLTLPGPLPPARVGASFLTTLGLPELIASSETDYIVRAAALARDLPRLAGLRAELRERMQRSPLMDAPRFARNVEGAYRAMWHRWCGQRTPTIASTPPAPSP